MSDFKKTIEVVDYLKRNKSKFHNLSARKVCHEVRTMFDVEYSEYRMRKMMDAAGVALNRHKPSPVKKISLDGNDHDLKEIQSQLYHMEKKIDFICDFIQYAKTGEVPQ
tara:strand:- start:88 stop:414 length:327 start_codon:yes stop_codon:yes gene_type:complete